MKGLQCTLITFFFLPLQDIHVSSGVMTQFTHRDKDQGTRKHFNLKHLKSWTRFFISTGCYQGRLWTAVRWVSTLQPSPASFPPALSTGPSAPPSKVGTSQKYAYHFLFFFFPPEWDLRKQSYCRREQLPVPGRLLELAPGQPDLLNKCWLLLAAYWKKQSSLAVCCSPVWRACRPVSPWQI